MCSTEIPAASRPSAIVAPSSAAYLKTPRPSWTIRTFMVIGLSSGRRDSISSSGCCEWTAPDEPDDLGPDGLDLLGGGDHRLGRPVDPDPRGRADGVVVEPAERSQPVVGLKRDHPVVVEM